MPIQDGKYVAPTWYNDTNPPINAAELQDICDSIAQLPVANGGTGATTVLGARNNLGFTSAGNANTPVYFGSDGLPTPITGNIPINRGGTGMSNTVKIYGEQDDQFLIVKWGNVVMLRYRAYSPVLVRWNYDLSTISTDILPRSAVYAVAQGVSMPGDVTTPARMFYNVIVTTDGEFIVQAPPNNTNEYYPRCTVTWLVRA